MPAPLDRIFENAIRLAPSPAIGRGSFTPGVDPSFGNGPGLPVSPQDVLTRARFTGDAHDPVELQYFGDIFEYRFGEEEDMQGNTFNEVDADIRLHPALITGVSLGGGGPNDYIYDAEADDSSGVSVSDASPVNRCFGQNLNIIPAAVGDKCQINVGLLSGTYLVQYTEQYNLEPICPPEA